MNIDWYCINLDSRPDRMAQANKEFSRLNLDVKRFRGRTSDEWVGNPTSIRYMLSRNPGGPGCTLSHLLLMEKAEQMVDPHRILGVFEDDVLLCDDFNERLAYIEQHVTQPWDIFFLNSTYHCNPPVWHKEQLGRDFEQTDVKYIHRVYGLFATQSYLINPTSASKILEAMRANLERAYAIDHLYIFLQPTLNCYCFTPGMTFQRDGKSDHSNGLTRFSNFYRSCGLYVFAKRLKDFDYDNWNWAEGARQCNKLQ